MTEGMFMRLSLCRQASTLAGGAYGRNNDSLV